MERKDEPLQLITLEKNDSLFYVASVNHKKDIVRVYFKTKEPEDYKLDSLEMSMRKSRGEKLIKVPRGEAIISVKVFTNK